MLLFRSRLFLKWVGVYALLLAVPTLVTGIVSYGITSRILIRQAEASSLASVESARRALDAVFRDVDNLTVLLEYLPWLRRIVDLSEDDARRADRIEPNDLVRIISYLRTCRVRYPAIAEIAVFIKNCDMVIDCEGRFDIDDYFGIRYSLFDPAAGAISRIDWTDTAALFAPAAQVQKYTTAPVERVLVGRKLPRGSPQPRAEVLFQLDKGYLVQTLEPFLGTSTGAIAAVAPSGTLIQAAGSLPEDLLGLIEARSPGGQGQVSYRGRGYAYSWAASDPDHVGYVAVTPVADLLAQAQAVRSATIALTCGVLAIGLLLAYLTTRHNFLPISELAQRLPLPAGSDTGATDELSLISATLAAMSTERQELSNRLRRFMPVVRANILNRLLAGRSEALTIEELESCGIRFPGRRATAAILVLEPHDGETLSSGLGRTGMSTLILGEIEQHFSHAGEAAYAVEQDPFEYRLVLSTDASSSLDLRPRFEELIHELRHPRNGEPPVAAMAALGDLHEPPAGVSRGFAEARQAMDCRFALPEAQLILYAELSDAVRREFAFDTEATRALGRLLALGDHRQLDRFIDDLLGNSIMEHRMAARGPYALLELLLHAIQDADGIDPRLAQSVNFNELAALADDGERLAYCRSTFMRVADAAAGRTGPHTRAIGEIVAYLDAHYQDPAISLTQLADRFGLSPVYISRSFKQRTGSNFLDYLNRRRIGRARELLADPRAVVKEVGAAAGFASEASFRRVFHRYMAMSPGEFHRQALRREEARA